MSAVLAAALVGCVLRGHRSATLTTPEQLLSGFFSAGRQLDR